jgi:hypothetical protein
VRSEEYEFSPGASCSASCLANMLSAGELRWECRKSERGSGPPRSEYTVATSVCYWASKATCSTVTVREAKIASAKLPAVEAAKNCAWTLML